MKVFHAREGESECGNEEGKSLGMRLYYHSYWKVTDFPLGMQIPC
jgi:hypothetical protein